MKELVTREFCESDWPDMVRFYEEFYKPGYVYTNRRFFDWSFASPFRPDARNGQRLVLDGDKIIGIMGVLSWPLQVRGHRQIGEFNVNLFVDPTYRGEGLSHRLFANVTSGYRFSLSFGYNEKTLSMYQKAGVVKTWVMSRWLKCLDVDRAKSFLSVTTEEAHRLIAESAACPLSSVSNVEPVDRFGEEWDKAWGALRSDYRMTTWRDAEFLNWRYIHYPYPQYFCFVSRAMRSLDGYIALRVEHGPMGVTVRIVDLIAKAEARQKLLAHAISFARAQQAVFIDWVCFGEGEPNLLRELGFLDFDSMLGMDLFPLDVNPPRHRKMRALVTFMERADSALDQMDDGYFYFVKGDSDQDRAN